MFSLSLDYERRRFCCLLDTLLHSYISPPRSPATMPLFWSPSYLFQAFLNSTVVAALPEVLGWTADCGCDGLLAEILAMMIACFILCVRIQPFVYVDAAWFSKAPSAWGYTFGPHHRCSICHTLCQHTVRQKVYYSKTTNKMYFW